MIATNPHLVTAHQARLFAQVKGPRLRLLDRLNNAAEEPSRRLYWKLRDCGRGAAIYSRSDGAVVKSNACCRHRLCPRCGALRAKKVAGQVMAISEKMDSMRFLTLTLRSSSTPLPEQMKQLTAAFSKLRRTADWRAHVRGGVATIEVTYANSSGLWHPHIHALIDGSFWRQQDIVAAWRAASGGSSIVDIRKINSRRTAANYISKYVAKSQDAADIPDDALAEFISGMHGQRTLITFGTSHGQIKSDKPEKGPPLEDRVIGINTLAEAASAGDESAADLLARLRKLPPPPRQSTTDEERTGTLILHKGWLQRLQQWLGTRVSSSVTLTNPHIIDDQERTPTPPDDMLFESRPQFAGSV